MKDKVMQLPEKYKGATPGPWRIEADKKVIAGSTDGFPFDPVARFNISGRVELDEANARLIADAPMLACRVVELKAIVEKLLGIVESEYDADPEPEDLPSWKDAIDTARKAIEDGAGVETQPDHENQAA